MANRDKTKTIGSKREQRKARQERERRFSILKWVGLAVVGLGIVGALVWAGTRPATAMGEEVTIPSRQHIPEGTDPGNYPTNPPAGGHHYASTYEPGFYEDKDVEALPKEYTGYLVHNLEHGYVIFWYNCAAAPGGDCDALKQTIRQVMDEAEGQGKDKLIAFPWPSQTEPLVMTSWGRIMRFNTIDVNNMKEFVRLNYNQAPEPDAR